MLTFTIALAFLSAIISVRGHGYVQEITSGSTTYTGYLPDTDPYENPVPQRIVRKIPGHGPVFDLSLIDVQCNGNTTGGVIGSAPAPIYGAFAAGSQININWTAPSYAHMGPMITYMARAPSDITKWSPGTSAVWFKVAEAGKTPDGKWASTDLLSASNNIYTFTIPPKLIAGQYVIRHEMYGAILPYGYQADLINAPLSLWNKASGYPGAQVYPACIQAEVTGSGTAFPTSFVSFPGAYNATTPGIVYDLYNSGPKTPYTIPGPAVWTGGD